jgi:hypothetical protein
VAKSLDKYRAQLNLAAPHRSLASDGAIGNTAHQADGCATQHNSCCVKDSSGIWVIRARDFTHDPAHGADGNLWADMLRQSQDFRIRYVIWNRKQTGPHHRNADGSWRWDDYDGVSPHTEHWHLSTWDLQTAYDDTRPWAVPNLTPAPIPVPSVPGVYPPGSRVLKLAEPRMTGADVLYVQRWIGVTHAGAADGVFGPKVDAGVRWYQGMRGLAVDGQVGPNTWAQMSVRWTG